MLPALKPNEIFDSAHMIIFGSEVIVQSSESACATDPYNRVQTPDIMRPQFTSPQTSVKSKERIMPKYHHLILAILTAGIGVANAGDPKYIGDVPGRALSFTGLEGHVGIWTGSKVIEMQTSGMKTPTLVSFKAAANNGNYYGAKGIGTTNRYGITSTAITQQQYTPTYTYFAEYWPGGVFKGKKFDYSTRKWKDVTKKFTGKFRCDTLVDYAYQQGYGSYIVAMTEANNNEFTSPTEYYVRRKGYTTLSQAITPNRIYNSLPETR